MKNILVTGGAGYIGSFMTRRLIDEGFGVTVVDNLERGHKEVVDNRAKFKIGDLMDPAFMNDVFSSEDFDGVIHFAGLISVGESVGKPDEYFRINTVGSLLLLEQMRMKKVNKIIFSSTAGIYGNPTKIPIPEDHPKNPESPYGMSKLLVENGLSWYSNSFGINSVSLRYFNAAGASLDGSIGENHKFETHIIPNIIYSILHNKEFTLFGEDYSTTDGTCIRDYIHVLDLVEAHLSALKKVESENGSFAYNVGTGIGYSNKEVISSVEKITGKKVNLSIKPKRKGDAEVLIADNSKIKKELNFSPKYSDLSNIIETAWKWHSTSSEFKISNSE